MRDWILAGCIAGMVAIGVHGSVKIDEVNARCDRLNAMNNRLAREAFKPYPISGIEGRIEVCEDAIAELLKAEYARQPEPALPGSENNPAYQATVTVNEDGTISIGPAPAYQNRNPLSCKEVCE